MSEKTERQQRQQQQEEEEQSYRAAPCACWSSLQGKKVFQSQTDHRKKSVSSSLYFWPNFSIFFFNCLSHLLIFTHFTAPEELHTVKCIETNVMHIKCYDAAAL